MPKATEHIWYQGKELDQLTLQIIRTADKLLALPMYGGEREPMTLMQGSFRPYSTYSGPTHRGGGTVDISAFNWTNRVTVLDLLGAVAFHRTPAQGFDPHIHFVVDGLGTVDPYAQGQITNGAKVGHNGLKGNGTDPDKALRSGLWPLAVYAGRTGVLTATENTTLRAGPSSKSKARCSVQAGTQVTALMEVRNGAGNKWFVTDCGGWGYSPKWEAA